MKVFWTHETSSSNVVCLTKLICILFSCLFRNCPVFSEDHLLFMDHSLRKAALEWTEEVYSNEIITKWDTHVHKNVLRISYALLFLAFFWKYSNFLKKYLINICTLKKNTWEKYSNIFISIFYFPCIYYIILTNLQNFTI